MSGNGKGSTRRTGENVKKFEQEYERIFRRQGHCCNKMLKAVDNSDIIYDQRERKYYINSGALDVCPYCSERLS